MAGSHPRVFSIPAGSPFLPTLADALLAGDLAPLPTGDPLGLADVTILLPTRRSVSAFREVLADRLGGTAAILPTIRPIGDVDEEDHLLAPAAEAVADRLVLPAAISRLDRELALAQLTLAWGRTVRRELLILRPDEAILIPASAADATRLAADLARLIDDMQTAGVAWEELGALAPDDHARYFQITLDFLKIASEFWPNRLAEMGRVDPVARRDHLIRTEAARLAASPPPGPVIAAGSTGSIPATAALLKAIAHLPNGAVVLPGLDQGLDNDGWAAIGSPKESSTAAFGHPQFGLKQLIAALGLAREDVIALRPPPPPIALRVRLLSEALRPAETTDSWATFRTATLAARDIETALAGVGLIVARNEQEEALAIALAFREALEKPDTTAALVTPDRGLARRVAVELQRFNVAIDDSAGTPLDRLPPGIFARLVADAALSDGDPVKLLAVVKHPFAGFGMARSLCRHAARSLELALFRGRRVTGGGEQLGAALADSRAEVEAGAPHLSRARLRLTPAEWDAAAVLAAALAATLLPIEAAFRRFDLSAAEATRLLRDALQGAAADETGSDALLWQALGGEALAGLLASLVGGEAEGLIMSGVEYAPFLSTLLGEVAVTRPFGTDPRIQIWGTLEARLQSVDLLILGGLDEGVWPAETRTDPWLSRAMRSEIGLPPPERRIGLAAHDFAEALSAPRVLVSRAEKRAGAPTVASRWLQRLNALIGETPAKLMAARGEPYVAWARALDRVRPAEVKPAPRPAPTPPVAARPRGLSVTEIETLIRDPYAVYARHVLSLDALDPLGLAPDYALRGSLIHDALARFTKEWRGGFDASAKARLLAIGREVFAPLADFPDIHAIWSVRFAAIADWFIDFEAARADIVGARHAEVSGRLELQAPAGPFTLRGRADRIDIRQDGRIDILDFKTGSPPSARQVLTGLAPQLALEADMARGGAFDKEAAFAGRSVATLAWLALGRAERGEPFQSAIEKGWTADAIADEAHGRLATLIAAFDAPDRAYLSRARPMFETRFESPYDHLARVREWALVESGEEDP